jgi:hypothetical protein
MKTRVVFLVSVMAGVAAVQALHAQVKPPAFVVGEIDVKDVELQPRSIPPPSSRPRRWATSMRLCGSMPWKA